MQKKTNIGIIFAGGLGSRMQGLTGDSYNKTLVKVQGKPLLGHVLERFIKSDVTRIGIAAGHLSEQIIEFLKPYHSLADLVTVVEEELLGTGGAVRNTAFAMGINENFYLANGDTLTNINLEEMSLYYQETGERGTVMALVPSKNPFGDRVVHMESNGHIAYTKLNPASDDLLGCSKLGDTYLVNAGVYLIDIRTLGFIPLGQRSPIDTYISKMVDAGVLFGFPTAAQYFNVNSPLLVDIAEAQWRPQESHGLVRTTIDIIN